eukprot:3206525-Prymnesium_polylepis.1
MMRVPHQRAVVGLQYGVVLRGGRAPVRSRDRRRVARLLRIFRRDTPVAAYGSAKAKPTLS